MNRLRPLLLAAALAATVAAAASLSLRGRNDEAPTFGAHAVLRGQALLAQVRQRPPATLVFGDSIVEGTTIDTLCGESALAAGAWGARLADLAMIAPKIAAEARPKRIVVAIGINDTRFHTPTDPAAFAAAYRALITPWRTAGIEVSVATLAPVVRGRDLGDRHFDTARAARLSAEIRALAADLGLRVVPFDELPRDPEGGLDPTLAPDGVHPNADGYRAWHAILEKAVCGAAPAQR